jgi:NAD(P)-dependent dehydrogenase (short-subunit alcohol dehydrogenase family)
MSDRRGTTVLDPREAEPKPPFPAQRAVEPPGEERELTPRADHGEKSYRGSGKLEGRKALITGADSGIGRAVAVAYAREGADVLVSYHESHRDADETRRLVLQSGRKAVTSAGDIGEPEHCEALVKKATEELGGLDVLVNNAAFQRTHESIEDVTPEELDRTFRTNVYSLFYLCKAALRVMKPGGAVINTTSIEAYDADAELLPYATTKGAIVTFTKGLAKEAMKRGVRVNAVAPGPVWTPLIPSTIPEEHVKEFGADTLLGRPAQPAELAPVYVFLASNDSSYVTGMVYGVTGGRVF